MLSFHKYLLGAYYVLGFIRCEDVMINQMWSLYSGGLESKDIAHSLHYTFI